MENTDTKLLYHILNVYLDVKVSDSDGPQYDQDDVLAMRLSETNVKTEETASTSNGSGMKKLKNCIAKVNTRI
jgi:hypothetical protein